MYPVTNRSVASRSLRGTPYLDRRSAGPDRLGVHDNLCRNIIMKSYHSSLDPLYSHSSVNNAMADLARLANAFNTR